MNESEAKVKPTPGPWSISDSNESGDVYIDAADGSRVAIATWEGRFTPEQKAETEANAARIVAAVNACQGIPTEALEQGVVADLLAALEQMLLLCDEEGHDGFCNLLGGENECTCGAERARAAIAKARGE